MLWVWPPPNNSHHQDYYTLIRGIPVMFGLYSKMGKQNISVLQLYTHICTYLELPSRCISWLFFPMTMFLWSRWYLTQNDQNNQNDNKCSWRGVYHTNQKFLGPKPIWLSVLDTAPKDFKARELFFFFFGPAGFLPIVCSYIGCHAVSW